MEFTFNVIKEKKPSVTTSISLAVTQELKDDIQRIKRDDPDNVYIFNDIIRQFLSQLVEKFDRGEITK